MYQSIDIRIAMLRLWVGSDDVIMTVTAVAVSLGDACPLDVSIATCAATCSDPYLKWHLYLHCGD